MHLTSVNFYWIGGPEPVEVSYDARQIGCWWQIGEEIAWYCGAEPEELRCAEVYWGGADNEDDSVELVTRNSEPVGTLGRMISREELGAIIAAQADQRRADELPQIAAEKRKPDAAGGKAPKAAKWRKRPKRDRNQGELLLPIAGSGLGPVKAIAEKPTATQQKKAG